MSNFKSKWFITAVLFGIVVVCVFLVIPRRPDKCPNGVPQIGHEPPTNNVQIVKEKLVSENGMFRHSSMTVDGMELHEDEQIVKNVGDAKAAVLLMNHINWTVTKIMHYNDPALLEQEYSAISHNSIMLDVIKDEEVIHIIKSLMDAITDMRIEETERKFLQEELDQGMSDAIYDAIPNPMTLISANPLSALVNLASAAVSSTMNYKKAKANLKKKFKRANWELDKNRLWYLNSLNKDLLEKYWVLVNRYKIKDAYRVVEDDIVHLVDRLKDEDVSRKYDFLKESERTFEELPVYWYYRGQAAYECDHYDDALESLNQYQKYQDEFGKILRHDKIAANVAMLKSIILLKRQGHADSDHQCNGGGLDEEDSAEIRRQMEIIESNATYNDWSMLYYCAVVYSSELKDDTMATRLLKRVIGEFGFRRNNRLVDWKEFMSERMENCSLDLTQKSVSTTDVLFECKSLLQAIETRKFAKEEAKAHLEEICRAHDTSSRERLFCFCSMNYEGALKYVLKDVIGISICVECVKNVKYIKVVMPLSWIMGREGDIALHVMPSQVKLDELKLAAAIVYREVGSMRQLEEVDDEKRVAMFFPVRDADSEIKRNMVLKVQFSRGIELAAKCYQIAILFPGVEGDGMGWIRPSEYALGEWVAEKDTYSHWSKDESGRPKVRIQKMVWEQPKTDGQDASDTSGQNLNVQGGQK